jgi:uncharacterized protein (TIGR00661 family)
LLQSNQNNNVLQKPYVVYALLDWGLGHTTRSIPIIKHLIELNYNILVACNSNQKAVLIKEFPEISFKELEGYELRYATKGWLTILYIILQIPKILIKINRENRWIRGLLLDHKPDFIVSDNRYGFYSSKIPSIFVTHQLNIRTGLGSWADKLIRFFNYRFINRFTICWVPDFAETENLAGPLSHPTQLPNVPVQWLGALSRFKHCDPSPGKTDVLIILSGPEPQRTLLEKKILADAILLKHQFVLVRGLPGNSDALNTSAHIKVFNYLSAFELNNYLCNASFVIGRSGYTSIMDYMKVGVKAILIPTPGQSEQQVLAHHMQQSGLALSIQQNEFSLSNALEKAAEFSYKKHNWDMDRYKIVINEFLKNSR